MAIVEKFSTETIKVDKKSGIQITNPKKDCWAAESQGKYIRPSYNIKWDKWLPLTLNLAFLKHDSDITLTRFPKNAADTF